MTTHVGTLLGIPAEAMPAWSALAASLDRLAEHGRKPVCASRPEQWGPDAKPAARADAAEACGYCQVSHACAAFAGAADERHGVCGGVDRTPRPRRDIRQSPNHPTERKPR